MEALSFYRALKEERLKRDCSLEEISIRSNIPVKVLNSLETGNIDLIPGRFYIRSFLRSYLTAIGADEKDFFLKHHQEIENLTREDDAQKMVSFSKLKYKHFKSKRIFLLLVIFGFVLLFLFLALPQTEAARAWLGIPKTFNLLSFFRS